MQNVAPEYRYFTVDLLSNKILAEIPFAGVTYGRALNAAGSFSGTVPVIEQHKSLDLYENTMPGKTALFVVRNNVCQWGGIIWSRDYDVAKKELSVSGLEFTSYFHHRKIWKTWNHQTEASLRNTNGVSTLFVDTSTGLRVQAGSTVRLDFYEPENFRYNGFYRADPSIIPAQAGTTSAVTLLQAGAISDIEAVAIDRNTAYIYTKSNHGFTSGDRIMVSSGYGAPFNGMKTITADGGSASRVFTFPVNAANLPRTTSGGRASRSAPEGVFEKITVTIRPDTYEYVRGLIDSVFSDFVGSEFPNEYIEPGIRKEVEVIGKEISKGYATLYLSGQHNITVGQAVVVSDVGPEFDGEHEVLKTPGGNRIVYAATGRLSYTSLSQTSTTFSSVSLANGILTLTSPENTLLSKFSVGAMINIDAGARFEDTINGRHRITSVSANTIQCAVTGEYSIHPTALQDSLVTVTSRQSVSARIKTAQGGYGGDVLRYTTEVPTDIQVGDTVQVSNVRRPLAIAEKSSSGGVASLRMKTPHKLQAGDRLAVQGLRDTSRPTEVSFQKDPNRLTFHFDKPHNFRVGDTVSPEGIRERGEITALYSYYMNQGYIAVRLNKGVNNLGLGAVTISGAVDMYNVRSVEKRSGIAVLSVPEGHNLNQNDRISVVGIPEEGRAIRAAAENNVATLTTEFPHNFRKGQRITVTGAGAPFDMAEVDILEVTESRIMYNIDNKNVSIPARQAVSKITSKDSHFNAAEVVISGTTPTTVAYELAGPDVAAYQVQAYIHNSNSIFNGTFNISYNDNVSLVPGEAFTITGPAIGRGKPVYRPVLGDKIKIMYEGAAPYASAPLNVLAVTQTSITTNAPTSASALNTSDTRTLVSGAISAPSLFNGTRTVTSTPSATVATMAFSSSVSSFEGNDTYLAWALEDRFFNGSFVVTAANSAARTFSVAKAGLSVDEFEPDRRASGVVRPTVLASTFGPHPGNSDIGVQFGSQEMSGINIEPVAYRGFELTSVGEALDQYADSVDGFEYRIDCSYDEFKNEFTKTFVMLPIEGQKLKTESETDSSSTSTTTVVQEEVARNLYGNSSFEASGGTTLVAVNEYINPRGGFPGDGTSADSLIAAGKVLRSNYTPDAHFERGSGSTVVARTNMATNPNAASAWPLNVTGTGHSLTVDNTRKRDGVANSLKLVKGSDYVYTSFANSSNITGLSAGSFLSMGIWVYATDNISIRFVRRGSAGVISEVNSLVPGWNYLTTSETVAGTSTTVRWEIGWAATEVPAGTTVWLSQPLALVNETVSPDMWFSGTSPAGGDFTYAWSGTANASTSVQRAPLPAGATGPASGSVAVGYRSSERSAPGPRRYGGYAPVPAPYSLRFWVPASSTGTATYTLSTMTLTPGRKYTIVAEVWRDPSSGSTVEFNINGLTPNAATARSVSFSEWETVRTTFTATQASNTIVVRSAGAGSVLAWIDNVTVTEGDYFGPTFNSWTPNQDIYQTFQDAYYGGDNTFTSLYPFTGPFDIPIGGTPALSRQLYDDSNGSVAVVNRANEVDEPAGIAVHVKGTTNAGFYIRTKPLTPGDYTFVVRARSLYHDNLPVSVRLAHDSGTTASALVPRGWTTLRFFINVPTLLTNPMDFPIFIGVADENGSAPIGAEYQFDQLTIVRGRYDGEPFDGSFGSTDDRIHSWEGEINYSRSLITSPQVAGVLPVNEDSQTPTVLTNFATNPSMRSFSDTPVKLRTNLVLNPEAQGVTNSGGAPRWVMSQATPGNRTYQRIGSTVSNPVLPGIIVTWTANASTWNAFDAPTANAAPNTVMSGSNTYMISNVPGFAANQYFTSSGYLQLRPVYTLSGGTVTTGDPVGPQVFWRDIQSGVPFRVAAEGFTTPANTVDVSLQLFSFGSTPTSGPAVGTQVRVLGPMLETGAVATEQFTAYGPAPAGVTRSYDQSTAISYQTSEYTTFGVVHDTNLASNPNFKTDQGAAIAARNTVTNPSFESTAGVSELHRNLIASGSFENAVSGSTEVRRNLAVNPNAESGSITPWGASSVSLATSTVWSRSGTQSFRCTNTGTATSGDMRLGTSSSIADGFIPGNTYTVSAYINLLSRLSATSDRSLRILTFTTTPGATNVASFGAQGPNVVGVQRVSHTFTVPADATGLIVAVGVAGNSGDVAYVDDILIEQTDQLRTYFDGSTITPNNIANVWTGATNGSQSIAVAGTTTLRENLAPDPLGRNISYWAAAGSTDSANTLVTDMPGDIPTAVRVTSTGSGAGIVLHRFTGITPSTPIAVKMRIRVTGGTISNVTINHRRDGTTNAEVSVPANQTSYGPGVYDISVQLSTSSGTTNAANGVGIRWNSASFASGSTLTVDMTAMQIEVGTAAAGPFFSGSSSNSGDFIYSWSGTANASTSLQRVVTLSGTSAINAGGSFSYRSFGMSKEGDGSLAHIYGTTSSADTGAGAGASVVSGRVYTVAAWVLNPATLPGGDAPRLVAYGTGLLNATRSESITTVGSWQMVRFTFTATANGVVGVYIGRTVGGTQSQGRTVYMDSLTMVEGNHPILTPFSGSTPNGDDFTYTWTGSPFNSASTRSALIAAGVSPDNAAIGIQSTAWSKSGQYSIRVIPTGTTTGTGSNVRPHTFPSVATERTVTVLATVRQDRELTGAGLRRYISVRNTSSGAIYATSPEWANAAGVYELRFTATIPANTQAHLRLEHGGLAGSGDLWFDNLMVVEAADYRGPYFDGDTPRTSSMQFYYEGDSAASSTSVASYRVVKGYRALWNGTVATTAGGGMTLTNAYADGPTRTVLQYVAGDFTPTPGKQYTIYTKVTNNSANTQSRVIPSGIAGSAGRVAPEFSMAPGETREFRQVLSIPSSSTGISGVVVGAESQLATWESLYWHYMHIYEGDYSEGMFTGATPGNENTYVYRWTGAPEDSLSERRTRNVLDVTVHKSTNTPSVVGRMVDSTGETFARFYRPTSDTSSYRVARIAVNALSENGEYTMLFRARSSVAGGNAAAQWYTASGTGLQAEWAFGSAEQLSTEWQWFRRTFSGTIASNQGFYLGLGPLGSTLDISHFLVVRGTYSGNFFDGNTAPSGGVEYAWVGTPDASRSTMTTVKPRIVALSSVWAQTGLSSLRITPMSTDPEESRYGVVVAKDGASTVNTFGLHSGQTYTATAYLRLSRALLGTLDQYALGITYGPEDRVLEFSGSAPNRAGVHVVRIVFTAQGEGNMLRLTHGGTFGNGDVWWDDLTIVEGTYYGAPFNGSSARTDLTTYGWDGTPYSSESVLYSRRTATTTVETVEGADLPIIPLIFEYPAGSITSLKVSESAEDAVTRFFAVGSTDLGGDSGSNIGVASANDLLSGANGQRRWPILDDDEKIDGVDDKNALHSYAKRYLAEGRPPGATFSVSVNGSISPIVGTYVPGDWCALVIKDDFMMMRLKSDNEPRNDVLVRKIEAYTVKVPDGVTFPEEVQLTLVPEWETE